VTLSGDGYDSAPITLGAYGKGDAPLLTGKSLRAKRGIITLSGRYQQVQDLHLSQAWSGYGVRVEAPHGRVANVEIDQVGTGVNFGARKSSAYRTWVHDLSMIVNTPGGDDDFGAVGFNVNAHDIEISYSNCTNCVASSYDYGLDGGFVEVWEYGDRLNVHHNSSDNTNGVLEIGGHSGDSSARDLKIKYNTFKNTVGGFYFHDSTQFAMPVENVEIKGNTLTGKSKEDPEMFGGNISSLRFDKNIVKTPGQVTWSGEPASHTCNIYSLRSESSVGYWLHSSERVVTDGSIPSALPSGC
jgi:hypothetical protein